MTPAFTLFTPTYNSAAVLHRVWDSIQAQTLRDLEWLVVDDGSTDGTPDLLAKYEGEAGFPMRVVLKTENLGLNDSYRTALPLARAPLLLPTPHDDTFVPTSLEVFQQHWEAIPDHEGFAGVSARCASVDGVPLEDPLPTPYVDATPAEMFFVHRQRREKWGFTRTDLLRAHLPPDVDRFVPEGAMWRSIGATHRTRFVNDVLRTYYRDNADSLSRSRQRRYPRGYAYAMALQANLDWRFFPLDPAHFRALLTQYGRYTLDAGIPPWRAVRHLREPEARRLFWRTLPKGTLAALNDRRTGRLPKDRRTGDWVDAPRSP